MEIVKTLTIQGQFRNHRSNKNIVLEKISSLEQGESLVITAKEADRWKYPTNSLVSTIRNARQKKYLSKSSKYSVRHLKSGSYAVICYQK